IVSNGSSGNITIFKNNGNGTFAPYQDYSFSGSPYQSVVGDFDRDGDMDIAVARYTLNWVTVIYNDGNGNFGGDTHFNVGTGPTHIAVSDLNNDGYLDLATANYGTNTTSIL